MEIMKCAYSTDCSDIYVRIHCVYFQNDKYAKVKYSLVDKSTRSIIETNNGKLIKNAIIHWKVWNVKTNIAA